MMNNTLFPNLYLFFFSRQNMHIPTNSVAPFSAYKPTNHPQFLQSLWRRAIARNVSFLTLELFTVANLRFQLSCLL